MKNILFVTLLLLLISPGAYRALSDTPMTAYDGMIDDETPFHEIPITITQDNSTLVVDLRAAEGNLDTVAYLLDANGTIVAENDDRTADDLDALITFPQASAGQYTIIATRYGVAEGTTSGRFTLSVDVTPEEVVEVVFPLSEADLLAAGYPQVEPHPEAEWTILVYYGGDASTQANIRSDIDEFRRAGGSNARVRIIALVNHYPGLTGTDDTQTSSRLFEITGDGQPPSPETIDTTILADLSMGSAVRLAQYLTWAIRTYPAQRYAVALGGHGGGWRGITADDSGTGKLTPVSAVSEAFGAVRQAIHPERFDLLINDACSMGSVEYHNSMAAHFITSLASPEIIVEPALDMTLLVETLNADPQIAPHALSVQLIDTYISRDATARQSIDSAYLTHAATDLQKFPGVHQAIEHFATIVNQNPAQYSTVISQARANTYTYGAFIGEDTTVDVGHLMQQVIAFTLDPALVQAATAVMHALETALIYGEAAPGTGGLTSYYSIYFPETGDVFQQDYFAEGGFSQWSQMLRNYYHAITPRVWAVEDSLLAYHPPISPKVTVTRVYPQVGSLAFPPTISVEIVGRRIASGAFTIDRIQPDGSALRLAETNVLTEALVDDSVYFLNSWKSGVDQSTFSLLPLTLPVVSDGVTSANERLIITGSTATLEGRYRESLTARWREVAVIFDLNGRFHRVINRSSVGGMANIHIAPGAAFQAYQFTVSPDGLAQRHPGTLYTWPENGLTWSQEIIESGEYNLGFLVASSGSAAGFASVVVTIDNDEINRLLEGYANPDLGINFQRPIGWSEIVDFGGWLHTMSPTGDNAINIYYFRNLDNIFEIARNARQRFALQTEESSEAIYIGDEFGLLFSHHYQTADGQTWQGRALVLHRRTAQGERGIVFSVDAPAEQAGTPAHNEVLQVMLDTLRLFDAEALYAEDARAWNYQLVNRRIPYPMPKDWTTQESELWTVHYAPGSPATFAAVADTTWGYTDSAEALEDFLAQIAPSSVPLTRTYNGEYHVWHTASYTRASDGQDIVGRLYVTEINNRFYILRFETPQTEAATALFREFFEPIVDGFAPPDAVTFAGGGTRSSYVRSAIVAANDTCGEITWASICHGGGAPLRILTATGEAVLLDAVGARMSTDDLVAFQVGTTEDSTIDPFSAAVVSLQANLPDAATDKDVKMIAFGGVTVINRALPPGGLRHRLAVYNLTDAVVNIRSYPYSGYVVASVAPGEPLTAVARIPDSSWLRVRLPREEGQTGWVLADLFGSLESADEDTLKIGSPDLPNMDNMQSLEILLAGDSANMLNGVLIQTAPGFYTIHMQINGAVFEISGGSMLFWRGTGAIEAITTAEQSDVFGDTLSRRRPNGWTSDVLSGTVRIRFDGTQGGASVTSVAGTSVSFDETTASFEISSNDPLGTMVSGAFASTRAYDSLSANQILELLRNQDLFNQLDLSSLSVMADDLVGEEILTRGDEPQTEPQTGSEAGGNN